MPGKYVLTFILIGLLVQTGLSQSQTRQVMIDSLINRSHRLGLFYGNLLVRDQGKEVHRKAIGNIDVAANTLLTDQ